MKKNIFTRFLLYTIIFSYIFHYTEIYNIYAVNISRDNALKTNSFSNPSISATSLGNVYVNDTWTSDNVNVNLSSTNNNITGYQYVESSNIDNTILDNYQNNLVLYETNAELQDQNHTGIQLSDEKRDKMKTLEEGTIITQFYTSSNNSPMSIISLANSKAVQQYFQIFVQNNRIGLSLRFNDLNVIQFNQQLENDRLYTLAVKADKNFGYKFFLNGQKIHEAQATSNNYKFIHSITTADKAAIGINLRDPASGQYKFLGGINFVSLYDTPIDDDILIRATTQNENIWKNVQGNSLNLNTTGENGYIFREVRSNNTGRYYGNVFKTKIDRNIKVDAQSNGNPYINDQISVHDIDVTLSPSYYPNYTSKYQYIESSNFDTSILNNYSSNLMFGETNVSFKDTLYDGSKLSTASLNSIKNLDQGTIIAQFNVKDSTIDNQSIFNLYSYDNNIESYFSIYVSPVSNTLTLKIKKDSDEYIQTINQNISINTLYTLALQADKNYGYRIFLNGQKILDNAVNQNNFKFFNFIDNVDEAAIGYNGSTFANNNFKLVGRINYLGIYNNVIPENKLTQLTPGSNATWNDINNNKFTISTDGSSTYHFREVDDQNVPYHHSKIYNYKIYKYGRFSPSVHLESNGSDYDQISWATNDVNATLLSNFASNSGFQYSDDSVEGLNVLKKYDNNLVYSDQNVDFENKNSPRKYISNADLNNIKNLESGTIISQFYISDLSDNSAIISIGNKDTHNFSFAIYYDAPGKALNFWVRNHAIAEYITTNITLQQNVLHTIALQADPNFGYRLFLDGQLVSELAPNNRGFLFFKHLQDGLDLNEGMIGAAVSLRDNIRNTHNLGGGVNFVSIYDSIIPNDDLLKITNTSANTWTDMSSNSMSISTQGHNKISFREKRPNGVARLQSETYNIKIDKDFPSILDINFNEITTKTPFNKKVEINITADGGFSGIKNIQYQLTSEDGIVNESNWIEYDSSNKPIISRYFKGVVLARVTNNANRISPVKKSTEFLVDIVSISMPISLTFAVYDNDPGNPNSSIETSSPNYHMVNNGNRPIDVIVKETSTNPSNNITMTTSNPTAEDQIKIDIEPSRGFNNPNTITLQNGSINTRLGYLDNNQNNNQGYFNLNITPFSQFASQKYIYSQNVLFEFKPLHFISVEIVGQGTVTNGNKYVSTGEDVVLQINPDSGYKTYEIYLDGALVGSDYPKYTLKNIQSSHNIKVIFKKEITNLSLNATANTNSIVNGYPEGKAIDGADSTRWASWIGADRFLELTYNQETLVNNIIIKEYTERTPSGHNITKSGNFKIEYWDGSNWVEAFKLSTDRNNSNKVDFKFIEYQWTGREVIKNGADFNPDTGQYVYSYVYINLKTPIRSQKIKYTAIGDTIVSLHEFETYYIDQNTALPFNNNATESNLNNSAKIEYDVNFYRKRKYNL